MFAKFLIGSALCISVMFPTAAVAQSKYDFTKLKRETLNRGVVAVRGQHRICKGTPSCSRFYLNIQSSCTFSHWKFYDAYWNYGQWE